MFALQPGLLTALVIIMKSTAEVAAQAILKKTIAALIVMMAMLHVNAKETDAIQ